MSSFSISTGDFRHQGFAKFIRGRRGSAERFTVALDALRQTDRWTDGRTDGRTDTHTHTYTQTHIHTHTHTHTHTKHMHDKDEDDYGGTEV